MDILKISIIISHEFEKMCLLVILRTCDHKICDVVVIPLVEFDIFSW